MWWEPGWGQRQQEGEAAVAGHISLSEEEKDERSWLALFLHGLAVQMDPGEGTVHSCVFPPELT